MYGPTLKSLFIDDEGAPVSSALLVQCTRLIQFKLFDMPENFLLREFLSKLPHLEELKIWGRAWRQGAAPIIAEFGAGLKRVRVQAYPFDDEVLSHLLQKIDKTLIAVSICFVTEDGASTGTVFDVIKIAISCPLVTDVPYIGKVECKRTMRMKLSPTVLTVNSYSVSSSKVVTLDLPFLRDMTHIQLTLQRYWLSVLKYANSRYQGKCLSLQKTIQRTMVSRT